MRTMVMVVVLTLASSRLAAAEQAQTCTVSLGTTYDPATNEVSAVSAHGVTMRHRERADVCAESAMVQYWTNQGYSIVTVAKVAPENEQSLQHEGRRHEATHRENTPRKIDDEPVIDEYMIRLIVFVTLILGLGAYIVWRK